MVDQHQIPVPFVTKVWNAPADAGATNTLIRDLQHKPLQENNLHGNRFHVPTMKTASAEDIGTIKLSRFGVKWNFRLVALAGKKDWLQGLDLQEGDTVTAEGRYLSTRDGDVAVLNAQRIESQGQSLAIRPDGRQAQQQLCSDGLVQLQK
jgi:hypothetical protein